LENNLGHSVAEWLRVLVESPGQRLWAADFIMEWLARRIATVSSAVSARATAVQTRRERRLREITQKRSPDERQTGSLLRRRNRRAAAGKTPTTLLEYYQLCLEQAVLEWTHVVLNGLERSLGTFRHELSACRERVRDLARIIAGSVRGSTMEEPRARPGLTLLVPGKAGNVAEAEMALLQSLGRGQTQTVGATLPRDVPDPHGVVGA